MLKSKLIEQLEAIEEDFVVTVAFPDGGWSNIGSVDVNGCTIEIEIDASRPFASDN